MFNSWQKIEVTEKDTAVIEAERKLLEATEKWIASDGAEKEANVLTDQARDFVAELLMTVSNTASTRPPFGVGMRARFAKFVGRIRELFAQFGGG